MVMGWVRACLFFAILWAALLCVRCSQTKWNSLEVVDDASLPINAADQSFCFVSCFILYVFVFVSVLWCDPVFISYNNYITK